MATTLYVSDELKERLVQAAHEAGFAVKSGRGSELPQFLEHLLDRNPEPDLAGASSQAVWEQFQREVSPLLTKLTDEMATHSQKIRVHMDAVAGSFFVSQNIPRRSLSTNYRHYISERVSNWTGVEFRAFGMAVKDILGVLFEGPNFDFASKDEATLFLRVLEDAIYQLGLGTAMKETLGDVWGRQGYAQPFPKINLPELADGLFTDLNERAIMKNPNRFIQRAKFALRLDPNCSDAYLCWGSAEEIRGRLEVAIELYQKAIKKAEEKLGPEVVESGSDIHWWYSVGTRPYMRARSALALAYWKSGQFGLAIEHFEAMLKLNPGDNQGMRYCLLCCLLEAASQDADTLDALERALAEHRPEVPQALWSYTYACFLFASYGPKRKANDALRRAFRVNKHVPVVFLLDIEDFDVWIAQGDYPGWAIGQESEAIMYYKMAFWGWEKTAGALDWLKQRAGRSTILEDQQLSNFSNPIRARRGTEAMAGFGPIEPELELFGLGASYPPLDDIHLETDLEAIIKAKFDGFEEPDSGDALFPTLRGYLLSYEDELVMMFNPEQVSDIDLLVEHLIDEQMIDEETLPLQWWILVDGQVIDGGESAGRELASLTLPVNMRSRGQQTVSPNLLVQARNAPDIEVDKQIIANWKLRMLNELGFIVDDNSFEIEPFTCPARLHVIDGDNCYVMMVMPDIVTPEQIEATLNLLVEGRQVETPVEIFILEDDEVKAHTTIGDELDTLNGNGSASNGYGPNGKAWHG